MREHRWAAFAGALTAILLLSSGAVSAQEKTDPPRPLYPEIIVSTDDGYSSDSALAALRAAAVNAGEARDGADLYGLYDPRPMMRLMSDRVEVWVAQGTRAYRQDFVSLGLHSPETAMEIAGRLSYPGESVEPVVWRRHAMHAIAAMIADPVVGPTPWLEGRICTASYGKVSWPDWMALSTNLKWGGTDWVIAVDVKAERGLRVDPGWPRRFQLVPVSPEQKRAGGWLGVLSPGGARVFFRTFPGDDASYFASYLNNHVCFEMQNGAWKISGIAIRLER